MIVGILEEMIDDDHAIVSSSLGPESYSSIMSFVDKSLLEPNCSVLLHNKVCNFRNFLYLLITFALFVLLIILDNGNCWCSSG